MPNASAGMMGQGDYSQMDGPYGARIAQGNMQAEAGSFVTPHNMPFAQNSGKRALANLHELTRRHGSNV